jgi:hypothetical protein
VVPNGGEIVRIIFWKERIAGAQRGVMDAEMLFEHLSAPADRTKPLARRVATPVVAAQIWQRLFTFENCGYS